MFVAVLVFRNSRGAYPSLCWEVSISFLRYFPDHLPNFSYKLRLLIDILTRKGNADLPAKRGIPRPEFRIKVQRIGGESSSNSTGTCIEFQRERLVPQISRHGYLNIIDAKSRVHRMYMMLASSLSWHNAISSQIMIASSCDHPNMAS